MSVSDTSEDPAQSLHHIGNGRPCRFFNRSDTGCLKGPYPENMHTPDFHSLRLSLTGPNICLAHLARTGGCALGTRCWYSHDLSRADLPLDNEGALWQTLEDLWSMPREWRHFVYGDFIKERGEGEPIFDVSGMSGEEILLRLGGRRIPRRRYDTLKYKARKQKDQDYETNSGSSTAVSRGSPIGQECIKASLTEGEDANVAPRKPPRANEYTHPWWTDELTVLRDQRKAITKKIQRRKQPTGVLDPDLCKAQRRAANKFQDRVSKAKERWERKPYPKQWTRAELQEDEQEQPVLTEAGPVKPAALPA